jgi:hypothetical protein
MAIADGGDRAMLDARRHRLETRGLKPFDHLVGAQASGEIDIVDGQAEKTVADRSADVAGLPFAAAERVEKLRHAAMPAPFLRVEPQLHRSRRDRLTSMAAVAPQIRLPFHSTCQ